MQVQRFREQLKEDDYFKGAGYMRTLSIYSHTKATLQRALRIIRDPTSTTVRTSSGDQQPTGNGQAVPVNNETALAKLQPPTFDGNQADWQRYKDKITSMDINASGPDIFKLERLHQSLTGKAALVVSGIRATAENFRLTWDTLCRQYDNIHRRLEYQLDFLFNLPSRDEVSVDHLNLLLTAVNESLVVFKSLELPTEKWDAWLIHCAVRKLDPSTRFELAKISG